MILIKLLAFMLILFFIMDLINLRRCKVKYYFKYKVFYKKRNGEKGSVLIRADNPSHLVKRFKEKYPSRQIIRYEVKEDS